MRRGGCWRDQVAQQDQPGYDVLWTWVDPARAAVTGQAVDLPGIPFRTLARIIDRLERL